MTRAPYPAYQTPAPGPIPAPTFPSPSPPTPYGPGPSGGCGKSGKKGKGSGSYGYGYVDCFSAKSSKAYGGSGKGGKFQSWMVGSLLWCLNEDVICCLYCMVI